MLSFSVHAEIMVPSPDFSSQTEHYLRTKYLLLTAILHNLVLQLEFGDIRFALALAAAALVAFRGFLWGLVTKLDKNGFASEMEQTKQSEQHTQQSFLFYSELANRNKARE